MKKLREHWGILIVAIIYGIFADLRHGDILGFFITVIMISIISFLLICIFDFIESMIRNHEKELKK